jgi:ATP/maltotriose-dependent transcriptional regulator MalT
MMMSPQVSWLFFKARATSISELIGQVLYISENTVKAHVKSILTKLDAMGRTEAIAIALQRGLIRSRS